MGMNLWMHLRKYWHLFGSATITALCMALFFPLSARAQSILLGSDLKSGQLDNLGFIHFIVIAVVETGTILWVGAQFWLLFVLQLSAKGDETQESINQEVQERFERRWSLPLLCGLLIANIGVLVGQALLLTNGQWAQAFAPSLLLRLVSEGQFGTYWIVREVVLLLAIGVAVLLLVVKKRALLTNMVLPSANLLLGSMLCIAIAMSGHASAVDANISLGVALVDWFHLIAASLWVGGMMYVATIYLPILGRKPLVERVQSLLRVLPYYSSLAITGIVVVAITGPLSATAHLSAWQQLFTSAYGRALAVKVVLVGALLITSAMHMFFLRPRLAKEYKKYIYAKGGVTFNQAQQVKFREGRLMQRAGRLTTVLRWEPLLGVAVIACVGLMNVFVGTSAPTSVTQPQKPATVASTAYNTTAQTADHAYVIKLNINPNRFGTNIFTVTVIDNQTGKQTTNVGVTIFTTMLDMDMGTDSVSLQSDGKGHFSAVGDFAMSGDWQIRVQVRSPDHILHEASVKIVTPF